MHLLKRILSKFKIGDDCWEWTAYRMPAGYGTIGDDGELLLAHRAMWTLFVGPIPKGMCVLHKCDNPPCVRPGHLFLGTYADNAHDMIAKGRYYKGVLKSERVHSAKMTWEKVMDIRSRHESGESQASIARSYGLTRQNVGCIVRRETWHETTINGCPWAE